MVKRSDNIKQITIEASIHDRFMSFQVYNESKEGILVKLMDMADKYKAMTNHRKKPKGDVNERDKV